MRMWMSSSINSSPRACWRSSVSAGIAVIFFHSPRRTLWTAICSIATAMTFLDIPLFSVWRRFRAGERFDEPAQIAVYLVGRLLGHRLDRHQPEPAGVGVVR